MYVIFIDLFFAYVVWNLKLLLLCCEYGEDMWCMLVQKQFFQAKERKQMSNSTSLHFTYAFKHFICRNFYFRKSSRLWDTVEEYRMHFAFPQQHGWANAPQY
jgi:hypothetical protein